MCFTPWVSLFTAVIEFVVATFILIRYKDYLVPAFSAILIYVLGLYQLSEFMLCTTSNPHLWATVGFAMYTFLPAIVLHMSLRFSKYHSKNYLVYVPAAIFSLIAFLKDDFIASVVCERFFVASNTLFTDGSFSFANSIYVLYYSIFILVAGVILVRYVREHHMKSVYLWWIVSACLVVGASLILMVVLPSMNYKFPSVFCKFALFFTIVAVISSEAYYRRKKKEKLI